jgi:hypothetical protein
MNQLTGAASRVHIAIRRAACGAAATALMIALAPPPPAGAQAPSRPGTRGWTTARTGKWVLLGISVGFGVYALSHSQTAERSYDRLRGLCQTQPARCTLTNNRYDDAAAEGFYDRAVTNDRQARVGILGGQVTLLGSAALFIYDLRNGGRPPDIPYPPAALRAQAGRRLVIGLRVPLSALGSGPTGR